MHKTNYISYLLGVESNWNSFEIRSIQFKLFDSIDPREQKCSKIGKKINSKFVRFDLTPNIGWSQIFKMMDWFEIRLI